MTETREHDKTNREQVWKEIPPSKQTSLSSPRSSPVLCTPSHTDSTARALV